MRAARNTQSFRPIWAMCITAGPTRRNLVDNCNRAIQASRKALDHVSSKRHPEVWARIHGNRSAVSPTLAYAEHPNQYCRKSIELAQEIAASKIDDYGWALINAAAAHVRLAGVENPASNLRKALSICDQAGSLFSPTEAAADCANVSHVRGAAHSRLARLEDRDNNLAAAIRRFHEAHKARTPLDRPSEDADTRAELAAALLLGAGKSRISDVHRAITLCDTGLFISEREESLILQAELLRVLGQALLKLTELEGRTDDCTRAIESFRRARAICSEEKLELPVARLDELIAGAQTICRTLSAGSDKVVGEASGA
jgi:tetratricopeptide (TPR) repeat protein